MKPAALSAILPAPMPIKPFLLILPLLLASACTMRPAPPATPQTTTIEHWLDQPPTVTFEHGDYDQLFQAAQEVVRAHFFTLDRTDYRMGVVTSHPMVSRQFFELWRRDTATPQDLLQSSLSTVRRRLHFQIDRADPDEPEGPFVIAPRVVVERLAQTELRYTTAIQYRGAFMHEPDPAIDVAPGDLPVQYWYAIGRDEALEQRLIWSIAHRLR